MCIFVSVYILVIDTKPLSHVANKLTYKVSMHKSVFSHLSIPDSPCQIFYEIAYARSIPKLTNKI